MQTNAPASTWRLRRTVAQVCVERGMWLLIAPAIAIMLSGAPAPAQERGARAAAPPRPAELNSMPNRNAPIGRVIEHLKQLSPEQQQRVLNSPRFKSLPPDRQQQIRRALGVMNGGTSKAVQGSMGAPHTPAFIERLRAASPQEQEKMLESDPRFQELPPDRQQMVRENLRRWDEATPAERQALLEREQIVQSLSPEQRDQLRQIFPRWRNLPADRRQAVTQAFLKLRDLPPDQRQKYLSSPDVAGHFSPEERDILSSLGNLLPKN